MYSQGNEMPRYLIMGLRYKDGAWRDIRGNIPEFIPKNGDWKPTDALEATDNVYDYDFVRNKSCLMFTGK